MNTVLSFMDKIYSDSKTLSIVYIVGAVLLFVFIILLMISLRKPDKKEELKIIEPKIDDNNEEKQNEVVVENKNEKKTEEKIETVQEEKVEPTHAINEQSIFEKTTIIPLDELNKEDNIEKALENVENNIKEEKVEEKSVNLNNISSEIPDVDSFVDNVVKKTYEKNEQFSSVYVGNNTGSIKLDKVMENLNVDEKVVESIVPEEEKTPNVETVEQEEKVEEKPSEETVNEIQKEETSKETNNSLDNLKKALDEKKKEVELKQDDLKAKLESLKNEKTTSNETLKAEDLLNKLNNIKEK